MAYRMGMARVFVVIASLVVAIPTTETMMLTDSNSEKDESVPPPFSKSRRKKPRNRSQNSNRNRNNNKNKQVLSLSWGENGDDPSTIPLLSAKVTKAIKRNSNFWSLFFGIGRNDHNRYSEEEKEEEEDLKVDREKIRETLKKFYTLADPKFARASLASATKKNKRLPGSVAGTETEGGKDLDKQTNEEGDDDEEEEPDELLPGTILQILLQDEAYELVERMQLELGATPKHYMDFAYRSVTSSPPPQSSSTGRKRYRRGTGSGDDLLIGSGDIDGVLEEDQPSCNAVITSAKESPAQPPIASNNEEEEVEEDDRRSNGTHHSDRAVAFFASWWKWWMPFANSQWWKANGSSQADYDIGKSPFAGGSNGEVWRGRRICHKDSQRSFTEKNSDSKQDENPSAFLHSHRKKEASDRDSNDEDDWAKYFEESDDDSEKGEEKEETRFSDCDDQTPLILKRLRVERGYLLLEAGLREVYFGKLIARVLEDTKQDMYTVYVDHFFREVPRRQHLRKAFGGLPNMANHHHHRANDLELWIVFEDAGPSLREYIYSAIVSENGFVMHQHSKLWTKLRTFAHEEEHDNDWDSSVDFRPTDEKNDADNKRSSSSRESKNKDRKMGRLFLQKTLREILSAAAELHKRGIVHRDIKPSNVMCQPDEPISFEELFESESLPNILCKLGDFSSGWDRYTSENLYSKGPTQAEQTDEYAPPESYIGPYWKPFDEDKPQSYDSWSIGVLALELLLGTPNVFSVDQRTSALLTHKMKRARASDDEISYVMYLAALSNFCIFVPTSNETPRGESWPLRHGDPLHKVSELVNT
jgi:serine/threonine protein kinase